MLNFFTYILIPSLTLFLARGTDWFSTNFSTISIALKRQPEFLLWSLVTGSYFFFTIRRVFKKGRDIKSIKKETLLFFTAAWMMVLFVIIPYLPARFPSLSVIHVVSALLCSVFFFLCLLSLTLKSYWQEPKRYRSCLIALIAAASFCACAFILTGIINSAMEICFVITCSLLAKRLLTLAD